MKGRFTPDPASLRAMCRFYQQPYMAVWHRYHGGWTLEEALGTPVGRFGERTRKPQPPKARADLSAFYETLR